MTLSDLKSEFISELKEVYPKEEILSFYYLLIEDTLKLEKTKVFLEPNLKIIQNDVTFLKKAIQLLKKEQPIQYIIGKTDFFDLTFKVDRNVLIPRPETEELVAWIIEDFRLETLDFSHQESKVKTEPKSQTSKDQYSSTILDIGTGSGCIAISLAKNLPTVKVTAIDVSKKALEIAQHNAQLNKVEIDFNEKDILEYKSEEKSKKYDVIVSNPPYVRQLEKVEIKNNVLLNEPHLALFVDDNNPLLFYAKIADFAIDHLKENGKLYFEINQYLADETINLLQQKEFKLIELRKDLFGNKRMLKAIKK